LLKNFIPVLFSKRWIEEKEEGDEIHPASFVSTVNFSAEILGFCIYETRLIFEPEELWPLGIEPSEFMKALFLRLKKLQVELAASTTTRLP